MVLAFVAPLEVEYLALEYLADAVAFAYLDSVPKVAVVRLLDPPLEVALGLLRGLVPRPPGVAVLQCLGPRCGRGPPLVGWAPWWMAVGSR